MEDATGEPERTGGPDPAAPPAPTFGQRWGNLLVTAAILLVVAGVLVWVVQRGNPVVLEIDGEPITNADAVITDATTAFRRLVDTDGAHPPEGAGCWFAPPAPAAGSANLDERPRVACGPVRLGVTRGDQTWVTGPVTYTPVPGGAGWTAKFGELRATTALDAGDLVRPDGADPPPAGDLAPPDAALRDGDGRRVLDEAAVLGAVEPSVVPAADQGGARAAPGAACWFGLAPEADNPQRSDGALWCGPVRTRTSKPDEYLARVPLSLQRADTFATAQARANPLTSISAARALPPDIRLYRPDGRPPPSADDLSPPDPDAVRPGFTVVVGEVPGDLALTAPSGDARLVTPTRILRLDGLARVPRLGTGRTAIVAAPGEELVVARFRRTDPPRPTGTKGGAAIVTGTRRTPLTSWSGLRESGLLVVSAPPGTDPALEVDFDGVTQSISLATGRRTSDPRPALYRPPDDVAVNRPVDLSVDLPGGPPARLTATVVSARLDAWRERLGWAPPGRAFVAVTVKDLHVTEPCCAVTGVEADPRWTLVLPDGSVIAPRPAPAPAGTVVFEAPETVTTAELRLALDVTWARRDTPGTAAGGPVTMPLELPR